ncbi:hypothetical protein E2C01_036905 [Portunus trituberculatus]|uniref:Uncharacterized protein n=1 Tax=Portunus trituberculatus TaxID=210409 RepID=A0A5B7F9Z1_PORTR|nr:hypothetical protein [Portunus trituberculatus]
MVLVPHSTRYWQHRRAGPAVHRFGRVDNIHGQARQNLPVNGQTRRSGPLIGVILRLKSTIVFPDSDEGDSSGSVTVVFSRNVCLYGRMLRDRSPSAKCYRKRL